MSTFESISVLCLGDIMLDTFTNGTIERISPEAPVPVFKHRSEFSVLGGAGNVVRNVISLGAKAIFMGVVGQDTVGKQVNELLLELPHVSPVLFAEKERKTPHKIRYMAQGQQVLRVDDENVISLQDKAFQALKDALTQYLPLCQVVILSDYAKGFLTPQVCEMVIQKAKQLNIPVIVDPKGTDFQRYRGATILTPNLKELQAVVGQPCHQTDEIVKEGQKIRAQTDVNHLLVTRSQDGMTLLSSQEVHHIPAQMRDVFDVSGAGDTVVATLAVALASGMDAANAARLANQAAGIVVGKAGTAVVSAQELHTENAYMDEKIMPLEGMKEQVAKWRRHNLKVGFTNGCFDLLHLGHLHILKQAKAGCDRLIIGLNTDASVKRLKGDERPIQSEQTRAHVLAALEYVDAVVFFDEETPLNLIETLLPDVLVKGADYRLDQVVGADIVMSHGGEVLLAELLPGNSTTATVGRMRAA